MSVIIIAALDRRGAIGRGGELLFRISADMRHFKATTMGNTLIMGRKTFAGLPGALPGRRNIVLSRNGIEAPGTESATSLKQALDMAAEGPGDTYIIGGAEVYRQALPFADAMELTLIGDTATDADTFFPPFDADEFSVSSLTPSQGCPPIIFARLERIRAPRCHEC